MASMQFPLFALAREYVLVAGSFCPNGNSAVASSSVRGSGFSVARSDTGTFTVTFTDAYPELVAMVPGLQLNSADDKDLQFGAYSSTNKTLVIRVWDYSGTGAADIDANANNRISFVCVFRKA